MNERTRGRLLEDASRLPYRSSGHRPLEDNERPTRFLEQILQGGPQARHSKKVLERLQVLLELPLGDLDDVLAELLALGLDELLGDVLAEGVEDHVVLL